MALPPHTPNRLPDGLCIFGMTYLAGLTWAGTPRAYPSPWGWREFLELAHASGLSYLEAPRSTLGDDPETWAQVRRRAEDLGMRLILAGGRVGEDELERALSAAVALGATTVRCTLSGILCGDRRGFPGGWSAHVDRCEQVLDRVVPNYEDFGVTLALENHQDADSDDLWRLCHRYQSTCLGITLDTGNPLAVAEEPVEFARKLAPYLRHIHLKDYRVVPASTGYRLVRCALGSGVIDFPSLLILAEAQSFPITRSIEMAALEARLIPVWESSWWEEYRPREAGQSLSALQFVWNHTESREAPWQTPFEREEPEELEALERSEFEQSLRYLRHRQSAVPG